MGYTHYWYVAPHLPAAQFSRMASEFSKMIPVLEHVGVKLAGPSGEGAPIIRNDKIAFNGMLHCGHGQRDLGITWPSVSAVGVAPQYERNRQGNMVGGNWFAGAQLNTRTCGGDCSHESFILERDFKPNYPSQKPQPNDLWFAFCKTAYKPYDLAVNVALIIAKHYLGDQILVHSDGEMKDWKDAMMLCQHFLGYGGNFRLDRD